jgi:hypothetical protein
MIKITQDRSLERWDLLPMVLREALYSEPNSDFLWKTCEAEHVPDKKIYDVARITGYVLMGFLHPEDVAEELHETIGVDQKTADSIEAELNKRIFAPLRQDIDKVYAPISKFEAGPKIVQEVKPPQAPAIIPSPAPKPTASVKPTTPPATPAPKIISETFTAAPKITGMPLGSNANKPSQAPAPAKSPSDAGWSKAAPLRQPVVKLGAITPGLPIPPAAKPSPVQPGAGQAPAKTMSEFERIDMMKKGPVSQAAAAPKPSAMPSSSIPTPPPVMLHETSKSTAQMPEFQFKTGTENQLTGKSPGASLPTKPAVLELGDTPAATPSTPKSSNYSEYKTPENTGPREISEVKTPGQVTAPPPKPPAPPMPPKSPTSPTQASAQKDKVIVKDFLA